MKLKDRSRSAMPDATFFLPFFVLFTLSLAGPDLKAAFESSLRLFFGGPGALIIWAQVCILNLALYAYFMPAFRLHIGCLRERPLPAGAADLAMRRLNGSRAFVIGASVLSFVIGRVALLRVMPLGLDPGQEFMGRLVAVAESLIAGFFVGVVLAMQFEDRLYQAKESALRLGVSIRPGYSSLYGKLSLILAATVLLMTLQAFSFASHAVSLAQFAPPRLPGGTGAFMSAPELFSQARRFEGLRELLYVFLFKSAALGAFAVQLLMQLRRLIARPLQTVHGRLKALNSPDPAAGEAIAIVQNDEFAAVYRQINALIAKQQGRLVDAERRLKEIVNAAADPILAADARGRILLCNPAAERLFGASASAIVGAEVASFLGQEAGALLKGGAALRRFACAAPDGERTVEAHVSRAGSGEDELVTVVLRDVSAQAELERANRLAREEAERASRMKSEFLANMSHELRTPLNAVLGYVQLLENDRNLTAAQRERLGVIGRSGEHLLAIINDILDISKIEAGRLERHDSVFDLHALIFELKDLFELKCRKKNLALYADVAEGLPRYVRGDLGKLRQVLLNLLGNAVKFTDEGGVGLLAGPAGLVGAGEAGEAGGNDATERGPGIRFAVRDTGRGIPEDERRAVLEAFTQARNTEHEGGTGLGLAISRRYIELMGGSLELESELGKGSVFSFTIPLPVAEAAETREGAAVIDIELPGPALALIADDQATNRLVLKEFLERVGFSVMDAADGRAALELARERRPDIVFLDLRMPVLDGYGAAAGFRADPGLAGIPVFALTASAFLQERGDDRDAVFDGVLIKPFKQAALYGLIVERGRLGARPKAGFNPEGDGTERPDAPPDAPADVDYRAARAALGSAGLDELRAALEINDFAAVERLADAIAREAPAVASALKSAARAFDEAAAGRVAAELGR